MASQKALKKEEKQAGSRNIGLACTREMAVQRCDAIACLSPDKIDARRQKDNV
jgi:hypothetical protein